MPSDFAVSPQLWNTVFLLPDSGSNKYDLNHATDLGCPTYMICRDGVLFLYFLATNAEYRIDELRAKRKFADSDPR